VMEIARARMPNSYDFTAGREEPLIPRESVFEVSARGLSDGSILTPADPSEIADVAAAIVAGGHDAVAVMLLNSYRDPGLEAEVAQLFAEALPDLPVTPSAAIWPEMREYERALVTCMNSYVHPLMDAYFERLQRRLSGLVVAAPFYITANNRGSVSPATARARPADTVLSGPASVVVAASSAAPALPPLGLVRLRRPSPHISLPPPPPLRSTPAPAHPPSRASPYLRHWPRHSPLPASTTTLRTA